MKKISILIALALIVTIGGVYATWNYQEQNAVNTDVQYFTANMDAYISQGNEKGNIRLLKNDMKITINDNYNGNTQVGENEAGDYIPEIAVTGYMIFTFSPFNKADSDVIANGIDLEFMLELSNTMTYDSKNIFDVDNSHTIIYSTDTLDQNKKLIKIDKDDNLGTLNTTYGLSLTEADDGRFLAIIEPADVSAKIKFANEFKLTTLVAYHAFEDALGKGNFKITIGEHSAIDPQEN